MIWRRTSLASLVDRIWITHRLERKKFCHVTGRGGGEVWLQKGVENMNLAVLSEIIVIMKFKESFDFNCC